MSKTHRHTKKSGNYHYRPRYWVWFIVFQLTMLSGWYLLYQRTVLSFQVSAPLAISETVTNQVSEPQSISIPSVHITIPITPATITNGVWETSSDTASFLTYSAKPTEGGNTVIYAHNKTALFGNLKRIKVGDSITITTEDGVEHHYIAQTLSVVHPSDVEVVMPTSTEVLTLYTCTGLLDSKRFVVRAIPV